MGEDNGFAHGGVIQAGYPDYMIQGEYVPAEIGRVDWGDDCEEIVTTHSTDTADAAAGFNVGNIVIDSDGLTFSGVPQMEYFSLIDEVKRIVEETLREQTIRTGDVAFRNGNGYSFPEPSVWEKLFTSSSSSKREAEEIPDVETPELDEFIEGLRAAAVST